LGLAWIENPRVDGSIPSQATNTKRLTVLGWAFSFALGPRHAGFRPILRVPPPSCDSA
jgi:hypothetical protein